MTPDDILGAVEKIQAAGGSKPLTARDPVNLPMIHNWVEAIGDSNPVYVDETAAHAAGHPALVAPPAMIQVWTMRGLHDQHAADDPLGLALDLMNEAGFTAVVATNCEQVYHRYLRLGELLSMVTRLDSVQARRKPRWAAAGSSPRGTHGTPATKRSRVCGSACSSTSHRPPGIARQEGRKRNARQLSQISSLR